MTNKQPDELRQQCELASQKLYQELMLRQMTIAAVESCTGGLLSAMITRIAGSSQVFLGSVVSYSNQVKESVLGVPEKTLIEHGAVSSEVARVMAIGGQRLIGADLTISITGIAGPSGGTVEKPIGTVFFGWADAIGVETERMLFSGVRAEVQLQSVLFALNGAIARVSPE